MFREIKLGGHSCHMIMGSGVCYLSADKYHLPFLLYNYIQIFNTILSLNLKPLHCAHVKVLTLFNTFT